MGAVSGTLVGNTEFGGAHKIITVTATLAANSDTITLTAASHGGLDSIVGVLGYRIISGVGANFATLQISYSGLVITVASFNAAGGNATTFGGIEIALLVKCES